MPCQTLFDVGLSLAFAKAPGALELGVAFSSTIRGFGANVHQEIPEL